MKGRRRELLDFLDKEILYIRLNKLDNVLKALEKLTRVSLKEFLKDEDLQAIVERRLQLSAQIAIDIANYLISRKNLEVPEEEENLFVILSKSKILSLELAQQMKGLVRFRNILVHNYLDIDPEIVYENFKDHLAEFRKFAKEISEFIGKP